MQRKPNILRPACAVPADYDLALYLNARPRPSQPAIPSAQGILAADQARTGRPRLKPAPPLLDELTHSGIIGKERAESGGRWEFEEAVAKWWRAREKQGD